MVFSAGQRFGRFLRNSDRMQGASKSQQVLNVGA